jgi:hypothetical protein
VWFRDRLLHAATLLQISQLSNFRQGSLGRIQSFAGTHGKYTPANGVEDAQIPYNPDKPVGWPWTTFALSGDIFRL